MKNLMGPVQSGKRMFNSFMAFYLVLLFIFHSGISLKAQTAEDIIMQVRAKIEKVNNYVAQGKLKTNVAFIKAPIAHVTIYFKKPDKIRIRNMNGISFIPKGTLNISLNNVLIDISSYDIIDIGIDKNSGLRIIKLLPKNDTSEIVLSTLYIDAKKMLIKKVNTTTRDNGTYELQMSYGKYADFGLADQVVFTFNTKDYKLPKGITFDYDDGSKKKAENKIKDKKGKVEISYSNYIINQGVPDSVFQ